jgi:hypothetical protein
MNKRLRYLVTDPKAQTTLTSTLDLGKLEGGG